MLHIIGSLPGAWQSPSCSSLACFRSARQLLANFVLVPSTATAQTGARIKEQIGGVGAAVCAVAAKNPANKNAAILPSLCLPAMTYSAKYVRHEIARKR